ncbi:unnamed protein product [Heligmosomoides polygyrus]|uniref:JmjC domain-containing protein n=1 Tax=Heligmosomoides polygyrus TaxID=6339 RepID=A0A183FWM2_HELPZ|nr:unnamed protein product [Heligmosomoides polygyrus]
MGSSFPTIGAWDVSLFVFQLSYTELSPPSGCILEGTKELVDLFVEPSNSMMRERESQLTDAGKVDGPTHAPGGSEDLLKVSSELGSSFYPTKSVESLKLLRKPERPPKEERKPGGYSKRPKEPKEPSNGTKTQDKPDRPPNVPKRPDKTPKKPDKPPKPKKPDEQPKKPERPDVQPRGPKRPEEQPKGPKRPKLPPKEPKRPEEHPKKPRQPDEPPQKPKRPEETPKKPKEPKLPPKRPKTPGGQPVTPKGPRTQKNESATVAPAKPTGAFIEPEVDDDRDEPTPVHWVPPRPDVWSKLRMRRAVKRYWELEWSKSTFSKECSEHVLQIIPVYFWSGERVDLPCHMCELSMAYNGKVKYWAKAENMVEFLKEPQANPSSQGVYFCYDELSMGITNMFYVLQAMTPPVSIFDERIPEEEAQLFDDYCSGSGSVQISPSINWRFHYQPTFRDQKPPHCTNEHLCATYKEMPMAETVVTGNETAASCTIDGCRARIRPIQMQNSEFDPGLDIELRWEEWTSCDGNVPVQRREAHCYLVAQPGFTLDEDSEDIADSINEFRWAVRLGQLVRSDAMKNLGIRLHRIRVPPPYLIEFGEGPTVAQTNEHQYPHNQLLLWYEKSGKSNEILIGTYMVETRDCF